MNWALAQFSNQMGSSILNLVPFPTSLSNETVPPSPSVNRLTTDKPNPWPLDLVVIRGVNSLLRTFSGMPSPVSSTVMVALPFLAAAAIVSLPPLGMA